MSDAPGRTGALDTIIKQAKADRKRLDSAALGPVSLTALGIASVVGAGIFVSVGTGAAQYAGPGVVISFVIAGLAAGVTALCFAELASMIPAAGSTYSYAYAAFGVFIAWFIGWDLLLEYLFAASTVAVGWAGYAVDMLDSVGIHVPSDLANPPISDSGSTTGIVNVPAMVVVAATTTLLAIGMRQSARTNNAMVFLKMAILILFVIVGAFFITTDNWSPFVPSNEGGFGDYGVSGVIRAAGLVFFAYVGFDAVSTAAAEARNPQRTIPIGLIATVLISTALYIAIGLVMTGMAPYTDLNTADPISTAIRISGAGKWLEEAVDIAAVVGLFSTVLVTFYGQTRIFMRMSSDGMLPPAMGRVSERFKTPVFATDPLRDRRRHRRRLRPDPDAHQPRLHRDPHGLPDRLLRRPLPAPGEARPRAPIPRPVCPAHCGLRHRRLIRPDDHAAGGHVHPPDRLASDRPGDLLFLRPPAHEGALRRDRARGLRAGGGRVGPGALRGTKNCG